MMKHQNEADIKGIVERINTALHASDIEAFCKAMSEAIALHNVSALAKKAALPRTTLYRAFKGSDGFPNFTTVLSVLDAMGLQLKVFSIK